MAETVYLDHYLGPLGPYLEATDVTDIYINRPNELWVERLGGAIERLPVHGLDGSVLERLSAAWDHRSVVVMDCSSLALV